MLPGGQGQALRALWEEFEAGETDDAKFANAVDRTQPFWGNFYIQGRVWKENGIEAKQVIRRNEVTKEDVYKRQRLRRPYPLRHGQKRHTGHPNAAHPHA